MNRADLAWALNAVIPHAGTAVQGLNFVNLTSHHGALFVYATDNYTSGIARVNEGPAGFDGMALSVKEATDLMRFVRPQLVGDRDVYVFAEPHYTDAGRLELHVGFDNPKDETFESEVYDALDSSPRLDLDWMLGRIRLLNDEAPIEDDLIVNPKLLEKFAKAARESTDRLWILPRTVDERHGGAVVACGQNFVGAVSGLSYDELGEATLASFLHPQVQAA
jgi:hypothetical protein